MKNLSEAILSGSDGIEKDAIDGSTLAKGLYGLGLATILGSEVVAPAVNKIMTAKDHSDVLSRLKQIYPARKHAIVEEVFGVMKHTAPHMSRNFLIAKTVVDQQISTMEAMSGASPMGAQISIPTVEQIAGAEQRARSNQRQAPTFSKIVSGVVGEEIKQDMKYASEPEESSEADQYINFLKGLLGAKDIDN